MPKIKTVRAVRKRFKLTKSGKIKRKSMNTRHILEKKSPKRKRRLRGLSLVHESNMKALMKMMPYGVGK